VIGDLHEPAAHPGYMQFCKDLKRKHKCDTIVFIGDIVDHHSISFHAADPRCPGPDDEYELTLQQVKKWYKAFPDATVTIGNHDARIQRLAETVNISPIWLRDYSDMWQTPKWDWVHDTVIDGVYYFHGTGKGGLHPSFNAARDMMQSVVMGHCHSASGVKWSASRDKRIFGMDVGCGVDIKALSMAYGKHFLRKPILSAAVVIDGIPHHEIMTCGPGEKYEACNYGN
jgi:predicted phosphodiesterase